MGERKRCLLQFHVSLRRMTSPRLVPGLVLGFALAFGAAAAARAAPEDFPRPASLEPAVAFWKRVYTEVDTSHGLLHDSRNLSVVYEVVDLPEGLSRRARDRWLDKKRAPYKSALRRLARGKRSGLSAEERRILAMFPDGVTNATLRAAAGRIRFQLGQADRFRAGAIRMGRWEAHIRDVLAREGLPAELIALPHVESSFNPAARSHVGASGIWQFTRSTGRLFMRVDSVVDERNDPFMASVAAARLLKKNHERLDSWPLALTGYNHGIAGMARAARRLGTNDIGVIVQRYKSRTFDFASRNFYASFLAASDINQDLEAYFGPLRKDPAEDPEIVQLPHYYRPVALGQAFGVSLAALREANPALGDAVWANQKYVPRDYPLRVPRDPMRGAPRVVLASVPESQRFGRQIRDLRYKVRRGDTVGAIARRYGVRASEIVALNGLRSAHRIRIGQVLELPVNGRRGRVAAAARPVAPPADGLYRVRRGDSLAAIARRFGVSAVDLAAANRVRDPRRLQIGQLLKLPGSAPAGGAKSPATYTVRRGDTLDGIARRFGTSTRRIASLNGIRNRHRIMPGQRLQVPTRD